MNHTHLSNGKGRASQGFTDPIAMHFDLTAGSEAGRVLRGQIEFAKGPAPLSPIRSRGAAMSRKPVRSLDEPSRTFPDRLFIPVPWKRASWLRDRLRDRGLHTTICYEPSDRTAGLEFYPGTDREIVLQVLRDLGT